MSFPDYSQRVEDHQCLLVLVKHMSHDTTLSAKTFGKIYDRIKRISEIKIQDAQGMGCERIIKLRYKKNDYEIENNEWGDFQAHRKVLGLITVGGRPDNELDSVLINHQQVLKQYPTVLDSRCLVVVHKASGAEDNKIVTENGDKTAHPPEKNGNSKDAQSHPLNDPNVGDRNSNFTTTKQLAAQTVVYHTTQTADGSDVNLQTIEHELDKDVENLISSLFWVLESKRLDRSFEKLDKVPLLVAPFENKTLVGVDTDTRNYKKRCLGRMRKHIADLSLLAGLPSEALSLYANAISTLKAVNDWLWLAAAFEGQCVASLALLYPAAGRRKISLQRNASLPPRFVALVAR